MLFTPGHTQFLGQHKSLIKLFKASGGLDRYIAWLSLVHRQMTFEPKTSFEPVRRCTYAASRSFKNSKSKAPFKNSQFPLKNRLFLQYFYIIFESEKQKRKRRGNLRKCSGFPCTCRGRVRHCAPAPPVQTLISIVDCRKKKACFLRHLLVA